MPNTDFSSHLRTLQVPKVNISLYILIKRSWMSPKVNLW